MKPLITLLALSCGLFAQQAPSLTAKQAIDLIKDHVGVPWQEPTVDTIKAGDPGTRITGIATTMMATFDVLKRAAAEHKNLVITHEPTFYGHEDKIEAFDASNDPVWREKEAFIRQNHLIIFRFHDHWHKHRPDGILTGMVRVLGWGDYQNASTPNLFTLPARSLNDLAKSIQDKVGIKVLRVVGNPDLKSTRVALVPGAAGMQRHLNVLRRDDVDVLVIGEIPEWETIEYVADAAAQGKHKALILMGHIPSEQAGMEDCAAWLKTFLRDVPVGFVPTVEPFWLPRKEQ